MSQSDKDGEGLALPLTAVKVGGPHDKWDFGWCVVDANRRVIAPYLTKTQAEQLARSSCAASIPLHLSKSEVVALAKLLNNSGRGLIDQEAAVQFYDELRAMAARPESETINAATPAPAVEERSCESASGMTTGQGLASAAPQPASAPSDAEDLLDWIASEYIKVDPFDMPTGQGDADVGWRFSQYHQSKPHERVIYEHFVDDLPAAIRAARSASTTTEGKP